MAYDYLGLVNDANQRLNEVPLTTANFATATGFYSQTKTAVNYAIREINQSHFQWPFNHAEQNDTLVAGDTRYDLPADASSIDWDSFRIKRDDTFGNETTKLKLISYDEYLQKYVDQEYNVSDSIQELPRMVFACPNYKYGVTPVPNEAYEVVYDIYSTPVDLSAHNDTTTIPEQFRYVINEGTMYYCYMFRSNEQAASIAKERFMEGIKRMRIILINEGRNVDVRTTYISRNRYFDVSGPRVLNG